MRPGRARIAVLGGLLSAVMTSAALAADLPEDARAAIDAALVNARAAAEGSAVTAAIAPPGAAVALIREAQAHASESAVVDAVIAAIASHPAAVEEIVAYAVGRAPSAAPVIVRRASAAFPGFAARVAAGAARPSTPPTAAPAPPPPVAAPVPAVAPAAAPAATSPAPGRGFAREDRERRWDVAVGLGGGFEPAFPGADSLDPVAVPFLDIAWGDLLFVSTDDGPGLGPAIGFNPVVTPDLRLAIALTYDLGRDDADLGVHRGLGDVDASVEFGGFAEYEVFPGWRVRAGARQDIFGGHEGLLGDLSLAYHGRPLAALDMTVRAGTTWAGEEYMQAFFGVDSSQAAASGLARFAPDAGFRDAWVRVRATYDLNDRWFVGAIARLGLLLGDAADSPVSENDVQISGGLGLGVRF